MTVDEHHTNGREPEEHPITQEHILRWAKAVAAVITGTAVFTASWLTLGLPVPATTTYVVAEMLPIADRVADLESYAKGTRLIILRSKQGFLLEEVRRLEQHKKDNDDRHIDDLIRIKKQEVEAIERQIRQIEIDMPRTY